ncbi:hypothetical protein [Streptomyces sp. NBC_00286]|uniref:hypothetical protein n=1 Tax=Streptomyces sp. NBC_00286 TaxID=2975701 RepID=UPI002E286914|nr:hypothetical protein [Streptomyces sp. NBC_00286]
MLYTVEQFLYGVQRGFRLYDKGVALTGVVRQRRWPEARTHPGPPPASRNRQLVDCVRS